MPERSKLNAKIVLFFDQVIGKKCYKAQSYQGVASLVVCLTKAIDTK